MQDKLECNEMLQALISYSSLHTYLLALREIARLSLKSEESPRGFNFVKLYSDIFKLVETANYYKLEKIIPFICEPLSILF